MSRAAMVLAAALLLMGAASASDYDLSLRDELGDVIDLSMQSTGIDTVTGSYENYWKVSVDESADLSSDGFALDILLNGILHLDHSGVGNWDCSVPMKSLDSIEALLYSQGSSNYDLELYDRHGALIDSSSLPGSPDTVSAVFPGGTVSWTVSVEMFSDLYLDGYEIDIYRNDVLSLTDLGDGNRQYTVPMNPWDEVYVELYSFGGGTSSGGCAATGRCTAPLAWLLPLAAGLALLLRHAAKIFRARTVLT